MLNLLTWLVGLLAAAAIAYTLAATVVVARFARRPATHGPAEPVTLLKPLHGVEPRLAGNLASGLDQDWDAPIQMVCGVQRDGDPALTELPQSRTIRDVTVVIDPASHGVNAKVSNLVNMASAARHDLLVLSDSDMAVPRDYLAVVAGALAAPGVGAATCAYRGRGDAGRWSVLAAAGISYQFLPQLLFGLAVGLARPGMGSTIALRRGTLAAVGGFAPFADSLADDYALCEAVRATGRGVAVPPLILTHGCSEDGLAALWRHELRWAATILRINPAGHLGTVVTHPVPLALLTLALAPRIGLALLAAALVARLLLKRAVDRAAGAVTAPALVLPVRDLLSLLLFVASFLVRSVDWRGQRLKMTGKGRIAPATESTGP